MNMNMNELDDLFDDELELDNDLDGSNKDSNIISNENDDLFTQIPDNKSSIIDDLLAVKGITDGKIKMLKEDETEEEIDFYSLSKEEQLEILKSSDLDHDYDLEDDEIELINELRTKGVNWKEYLEQIKSSSEPSYEPSYEIDSFDDQELFLLDLKHKYDLTNEELEKELEKELQDENLFKKKIDKIRAEYKELEDHQKQEQQVQFELSQKQRYNEFADTMVNVATKTSEYYGIELEDSEKNEVLSFILDLDENGTSNFYKTLNNPSKLYEAAWFLKYGKDAFSALSGAYEAEISKLKKDNKPKVVVKNRNTSTNTNSIHDIF